MKNFIIYTDGACQPNPGRGGWAAIIERAGERREIFGYESRTTNNRMELKAALEALLILDELDERCAVSLYTDSEYLVKAMTLWISKWKANNWKLRRNRPVLNADLWMALDMAADRHDVTWKWVEAHTGDPNNERCDFLATQQVKANKITA